MTSADGGFYSSLDADSEGKEGKYYTFTKAQIKEVLGEESDLFIQYFNVKDNGNWSEEETNVLYIDFDADKLSEGAGFSPDEWESYLAETKKKLFDYREQRIRPALDD